MIASDLTIYLASQGHGTTGSDLFTDDMPADPDSIVVVYEYPGDPSVYVRDSHLPALERPRVQVTVRGTSYMDVASRAEAVHTSMLAVADVRINGVYYGRIRHLQDGWLKTRDDLNRHVWKRNYTVIREAVTPTG